MAASRKLYRAIAENILCDVQHETRLENKESLETIAYVVRTSIAPALKADNPNFRYDKFFTACGLDVFGHAVRETESA